MTNSENLTPADCLDADAMFTGCAGDVEYRLAMSATGISYPRCDAHFEARWETQQRLARDYGVPTYYYGESGWSDDDY